MKSYVDKKINEKAPACKKDGFYWIVFLMQQCHSEDQIKQHSGVDIEEMNLAIWTYKIYQDAGFIKMQKEVEENLKKYLQKVQSGISENREQK